MLLPDDPPPQHQFAPPAYQVPKPPLGFAHAHGELLEDFGAIMRDIHAGQIDGNILVVRKLRAIESRIVDGLAAIKAAHVEELCFGFRAAVESGRDHLGDLLAELLGERFVTRDELADIKNAVRLLADGAQA